MDEITSGDGDGAGAPSPPRLPADHLTPPERRDAALSTMLSLGEAVFLLASDRAIGGAIALLFALSAYPYYTLAKRMLITPLAPQSLREAAWAYGMALVFTAAHAALFYFGWTRTGIGVSLALAMVMAMLLWAAPTVRSLRENGADGGRG